MSHSMSRDAGKRLRNAVTQEVPAIRRGPGERVSTSPPEEACPGPEDSGGTWGAPPRMPLRIRGLSSRLHVVLHKVVLHLVASLRRSSPGRPPMNSGEAEKFPTPP